MDINLSVEISKLLKVANSASIYTRKAMMKIYEGIEFVIIKKANKSSLTKANLSASNI